MASVRADIEAVTRSALLDGYSFEICAKDASRLEMVRSLVTAGTMVSITYLPTESDAARIAAACEVRRLGLTPMPHVAARRITSAHALEEFLARLAGEAQVDRLFVIAGDLPAPAGPYPDALAVIRDVQLAGNGIRTVGIAGYPEGHPQISTNALELALRDKVATLAQHGLASEIMTQFSFDADPMVTWLARLREDGMQVPIRLGLPGPANVGTLLRFAARCGVGASAKVMSKYGASITRLLNTAGPDRLYDDLLGAINPAVHGSVAVHLYPFGGLQKMAEWAHARAGK